MLMAIEDRNFVGIGKILIDSPATVWNIPNLHFIVGRSGDKIYEAVSLEFGLVSIGKSAVDSVRDLTNQICTYILSVINDGGGYKELCGIVRKSFMADYWAEYRGIEFDLAETGRDLSHDLDWLINKAIQESFSNELMKVIERDAKQAAAEIISLLSVRPPVVEYKEIQEERAAA
jgi:hypothetical protein